MVGKGFIQVSTSIFKQVGDRERESIFFAGWWKHHLPRVRQEEDDGGDWGRMNQRTIQKVLDLYSSQIGLMLKCQSCQLCTCDELWYMFSASGSNEWMMVLLVVFVLYLYMWSFPYISYSKDEENTLISHVCILVFQKTTFLLHHPC